MAKMRLPENLRASDEVLFQEIEGEAVLLNLKNEKYFGLDQVGTRIWHLLVEHGDSARVMTEMRNEYDIDEETLVNDLSVLFCELESHGLIVTDF